MANPLFRILGSKSARVIGRIVLFFVLLIGVISFLTLVIGAVVPVQLSENQIDLYLSPAVTLLGVVLSHWIMLRVIDKRPWSSVGLGRDNARPALLAKGLAIGLLGIGIPSLLLLAASQLRTVPALPGSSLSVAVLAIATFLPAAFFEELVMRGYLFMVMREAWGWKAALFFTSVVFGLLHMGNSNVGADSIFLVILAGFFLGAILLATGSLYAAGMAHFAWNWMMAAVLHANVSGETFASPDFRVVDNGPDWLTGGAWGPEGGFAAAMGMIVSFIYLYARRIRRLES